MPFTSLLRFHFQFSNLLTYPLVSRIQSFSHLVSHPLPFLFEFEYEYVASSICNIVPQGPQPFARLCSLLKIDS